MSEEQYRKKFAISQSAIKSWKDLAPIHWYDQWVMGNKKKKTSEGMEFGSLLDVLIFTPDQYEKRFMLADVEKPSDKICLVQNLVLEHLITLNKNIIELNEKDKTTVPLKSLDLEENSEAIIKFSKESEYYFLKKSRGKTVITNEQLTLAKEHESILKSDPISKGFFIPSKHCEVLFQQQLYADYELQGFDNLELLPLKGMLDIIHLNHKKKMAREVDLKYTSDVTRFPEAIKMFKYVDQHSFYDFLLRSWLQTYKGGIYKDYQIANPINVVIDDITKTPYLYMYNYSDLEISRQGIENTSIRGWEDILKEIAWHLSTNNWNRPKEHILNGYMSVKYFRR